MVRKVRSVYECPSCMGVAEAGNLTRLGGKVREFFRDRDGRPEPGVVIHRVLCWWCRTYHSPEEVASCMKIPDKRAVGVNGAGCSLSASAAGVLKQYSELWEFLCGPQMADGRKRQAGKLSLSCSAGRVSLTLNDPQTGQYCHLEGEAVDDLLLMAEAGLAEGNLPWRASSYGQGKRR